VRVSLILEPAGPGDPMAVTVAGESLRWSQLAAAGQAVAPRGEGAERVAIDADASLATIVAVVGCLLAGVTAVPVPPDAGPSERRHILADSAAQLWLGS